MGKRKQAATKRYSAKLLFQFRVVESGGKRLLCEERIICFAAKDAKAALVYARQYGKDAQTECQNDSGQTVKLEFVGVLDLCGLIAWDEQEVWYDICERLEPMKRRKKLLPSDAKLLRRA